MNPHAQTTIGSSRYHILGLDSARPHQDEASQVINLVGDSGVVSC